MGNNTGKGKFQILSLDGGGIKGLFSAAVLAHLEDDLKIKITDHFDLIVGTSTGGIIALGLGVGLSPKEIVQFYVKNGPGIFSKWGVSSVKKIYSNKYSQHNLQKALKECFGENLLADSRKRLVIPSYNIGEDDVYVFKTSHHDRLTRDYKVPLWKVAMATSAAPTYFPTFRGVDNARLIDGGVWANNPTMVGIVEAVSLLSISLNDVSVFSLGTTDVVTGRPDNLDNGGLWQWREQAVEVIMRGQSISAYTQAQLLLGDEQLLRMDPSVPVGLFALDKLSVRELLSKAAHESRHLSPLFKEKFTSYIAPKFIPCHQIEPSGES